MLRWQGDHDQAEQVLGQAAAEASTDEERGLVISARAENLFRGLGRYADAVRVLRDGEAELADPVWRDEMVALRGQFDLLAGGVAGALRTVEPILHGPPSRASLTASMTSALALAVSGRNDEAVQMADEGIEACSALSPEEALPRRGWLMVSRCFALVESGRLSEAESMATTAYEYSLGAGLTLGQGWFALILGRLCLGAGRLFAADRWFREAAAAFREVDYPGPLRWSLGGAAQAAAMRGDHDGAASAINEADLIATPVRLMETEIDRGRAWLVAMQGERTRAVDILRAAAGRARSTGEIALEGSALHDVVRLGEADEVAHRLTEIATSVPSATAVLRASHAEALVGRDARAMEEVVTGFEAIGALLLAAEAAAQSSLVWKRMGRSRQATAIARRAHELASSCEGARTPVLSEADTLKPLTRREREVCELASNGFTNHAIAERLFLSERTVENHLRAVYAKLGVAGREELRVGARQRVLQN
jgi:ATP/maltotriose-dependent transcriptional regulator MalT